MNGKSGGDGAWVALVAAERDAARRRAGVNRLSTRSDLLNAALAGGSAWDRSTALTFLRTFPGDVPQLLEQLLEIALAGAWARPVSDVIRAAGSAVDTGLFVDVVLRQVRDRDADACARLAWLLVDVGAQVPLAALLAVARDHDDPAVRDVSRELDEAGVTPGHRP
ncbi:hypothetical protein [Luteimicrobium subarcticum]|uniref:HEAT repeat protein n=1 Tax=Luteimicrobium subarcticum TaxID=620910 RepID=A0A2M8W472_9MICO|nr:hypothetical protein [Luteimicrobium subarcticum]PJI85720.1 hypothetical protein CLV34_2911 [Luteimicrobium subarcticum]